MNKNIIVVGIGGCGTNIINHVREKSSETEILIIDKNIENEACSELKSKLKDYKLAFLIAGMGGDIGSHSTSVVAQIAKEVGVFTIAITVTPFPFEGRMEKARKCIENISKDVDALLVVENEKVAQLYSELPVVAAFKKADETVAGITERIAEISILKNTFNLGMEDLNSILTKEDQQIVKIYS